jgi:Flp pilus assembly pilin Flp
MRNLWRRFWRDERGSLGVEWAFIATILVLGAITGVIAAQRTILTETEPPPPALTR